MFHTHDDFLNAIESQPADRTLRLVYADWLDERDDPRGELIRIEEEMRTLPVFADRFWELKPRRNALRAQAGSEWCGRMRYGTECEPAFRTAGANAGDSSASSRRDGTKSQWAMWVNDRRKSRK